MMVKLLKKAIERDSGSYQARKKAQYIKTLIDDYCYALYSNDREIREDYAKSRELNHKNNPDTVESVKIAKDILQRKSCNVDIQYGLIPAYKQVLKRLEKRS